MSGGNPRDLPIVGIFVGGRGTRMGGAAKGLLMGPSGNETLLERLLGVVERAAPGAPAVLVGQHPAYLGMGLSTIADDPPGAGPLGGLRALLLHAEAQGSGAALALAVDLPFVTESLLRRLHREAPDAAALAPCVEGRWEPLCARYAPAACLTVLDDESFSEGLTAGVRAPKRRGPRALLDALGTRARVLALDPSEVTELADWDSPEDIERWRRAAEPGSR